MVLLPSVTDHEYVSIGTWEGTVLCHLQFPLLFFGGYLTSALLSVHYCVELLHYTLQQLTEFKKILLTCLFITFTA